MNNSPMISAIRQAATAALHHAAVLVPEWLPDGKRHHHEWMAKNPTRGDRQTGSFSVSLLTGKWNDFADGGAKGGDLVSLLAYLHHCKQWQAAQTIDSRLGLGLFTDSGQASTPNEAQQAAIAASLKRAEESQRQAQAREAHDREEAKNHALWLWQHAMPASQTHHYLLKKQVQAYGLRQSKSGHLFVPVCFNGELVNLQQITPYGKKLFLTGGQVKGCYSPIGRIKAGEKLYICEGWATGATLHQQTGAAIACALNAGNLKEVALALRARYGDRVELVIAGDDDRQTTTNVGRKAANDAALAIGSTVIFPEWPDDSPHYLTDFND
jgi:putative DNA primase/helicase